MEESLILLISCEKKINFLFVHVKKIVKFVDWVQKTPLKIHQWFARNYHEIHPLVMWKKSHEILQSWGKHAKFFNQCLKKKIAKFIDWWEESENCQSMGRNNCAILQLVMEKKSQNIISWSTGKYLQIIQLVDGKNSESEILLIKGDFETNKFKKYFLNWVQECPFWE